jgi:hypothetical protein
MKAGLLFKICASAAVLGFGIYLAGAAYMKYTQSSRLKQEATAVEQFHAKENLYLKLLESWTEIVPAKCGQPASTPGFVTSESITREHDGGLSLATNEGNYSKLSIEQLATRLDAKPEAVRSVVDTLGLLEAPEIVQSGAEIKVISQENDTHGYLHIDQSCPGAATYASWSKQAGNFTVDNPGHYMGLKSLGSGWYYYMEQR